MFPRARPDPWRTRSRAGRGSDLWISSFSRCVQALTPSALGSKSTGFGEKRVKAALKGGAGVCSPPVAESVPGAQSQAPLHLGATVQTQGGCSARPCGHVVVPSESAALVRPREGYVLGVGSLICKVTPPTSPGVAGKQV